MRATCRLSPWMLYSSGCAGEASAAGADPTGLPQLGQNRASSLICEPQLVQKAMSLLSDSVDEAGDVAGPEAVIDIDHRHIAGAAVQHAEQRRQAVEAGPVSHAGWDRDDRA